ncbi:hypothetical protein AVEN_224468-1 [Araneus ventricosus]|uniref:Uncharacterized protein n=1 Tax=Araneus ventricosus TaxID=182803 RepID=A0A4Y2KJ27_ARAVE|nr:hypothetical protein AVEN_224468-1 [Araneus ventricosus]
MIESLPLRFVDIHRGVHLAGSDVIEPPEGMQKEEYEEWMSIDEVIPVAATLTDLEICQAIKVDGSDGDECVEENPPTNSEMRQAYFETRRAASLNKFLKTIRVRAI